MKHTIACELFPTRIFLFFCKKEKFERWLKKIGTDFVPTGSGCCVNTTEGPGVWIDIDGFEFCDNESRGLIVHEAWHAADYILGLHGVGEPYDAEVVAYLVQRIYVDICDAIEKV